MKQNIYLFDKASSVSSVYFW